MAVDSSISVKLSDLAGSQTNVPYRTQQGRLFRIYNRYRVVISFLLALLVTVDLDGFQSQHRIPAAYQALAFAYFGLNVFLALTLMAGFQPRPRHTTFSILIDLLVLHGLLYFSSGLASGLANLVIISVAAGNILNPSRLGIFFAALAALGTLGLAGWEVLTLSGGGDQIVRAGLLGILYFAVAFVLQNITRRLIHSEALATERAQSIVALEQLNHQIIQRMRTGIIVADPNGQVKMANAAAGELLLGEREASHRLEHLPEPLKRRLDSWFREPSDRTGPFQAHAATPIVQANFAHLDQESGDLLLIFLEDTSRITEQAQQLKLASLGRLTASIAHEIRNPLGAISHAAQLLAESETLVESNRRMVDIIQRHTVRVNTIIENVLELSRRRQANATIHDLRHWIETQVTSYRQECDPNADITLVLEAAGPLLARFDASQMEQVLVNLINNGLRYSEQKTGKRTLRLSIGLADEGERAYLDIKDQGPGVPPNQQAQIFEPFYTTEKGGTGLGLYLARELCEANQAQLVLINSESGGCFRIIFAHPQRMSLRRG